MADAGDDQVLGLSSRRTYAERLRGLLILTELVTLLNLPLKLLRELPLPGLLVVDRITVQRGLPGQLVTSDDRQMVLVAVAGARVNRLRRVDDRLQHWRVISTLGRLRLFLKQTTDRFHRWLLILRLENTQNFRALLADCRCSEEGVTVDAQWLLRSLVILNRLAAHAAFFVVTLAQLIVHHCVVRSELLEVAHFDNIVRVDRGGLLVRA